MKHTPQGMFDAVWQYFVKEKNPASTTRRLDGDMQCRYRGDNGAKCAFGIFIPDSEYKPELEGRSASVLITTLKFSPEFNARFDTPGLVGFIDSLQLCHDRSSVTSLNFNDMIRTNLEDLAKTYNLTIPTT